MDDDLTTVFGRSFGFMIFIYLLEGVEKLKDWMWVQF